MEIKHTLPVSYLLFTRRHRIDRLSYWNTQILIWLAFYVAFNAILFTLSYAATIILYPILFAALICTSVKRLHDSNLSGYYLFAMLIPVLGVLWVFYRLEFKAGTKDENRFGSPANSKKDYFANDTGGEISHLETEDKIINDVTGLNPVIVSKVCRPRSVDEIQDLISKTKGAISIGGGRFSMGGQTASHQSLHLDMRDFNKVIHFDKKNRSIQVQTGIRWCDIQKVIDEHDLSLKIMQTYANFTVGGSLSVNSHGRYLGQGPLILSVDSIELVTADGSLVFASRSENPEIFNAAIGGYNAIGVIVTAKILLSENIRVRRQNKKMLREHYAKHFSSSIRNDEHAAFHNGDIYPPHYKRVNSVTWIKTDEKATVKTRLMPLKSAYPLERYFLWVFSESPLGKWRREHIIDPLIYMRKTVHWKNYEAGYDVAELEPKTRKNGTYVLQEYFVPVANFDEFSEQMAEIFIRHNVNVINVSIRHAGKDSGSYMAWAKEEVFAFVIYYKQGTTQFEKGRVAVWTRELVDAAITVSGSYYLPYQAHATSEQFHLAYPGAKTLFELKDKFDPNFRFKNVLWNKYYKNEEERSMDSTSEFIQVISDTKSSDAFYHFLQEIFHVYPEDKFHHLIKEKCKLGGSDEEIYLATQSSLPKIKPALADIRYGLPALKKQKKEISRQSLELLGSNRDVNGYLEIGSTGRYISDLGKHLKLTGELFLTNDRQPDNSIGEIFERGGLKKIGEFFDLNDYDPISEGRIKSESLDVVTCYIGLHHCPIEKLDAYTDSIVRILKPGGRFIIREHDAYSTDMSRFVSLVHTVFNLGLNETWEFNQNEFRAFRSVEHWTKYFSDHGLVDSGKRILQHNDPSDNTLLLFTKK